MTTEVKRAPGRGLCKIKGTTAQTTVEGVAKRRRKLLVRTCRHCAARTCEELFRC